MSSDSREENEKHPLDTPYDIRILNIIRDHIHNTVVRKATNLNRNEYLILFNETDEEKRDWSIQAGRPILIMLGCHPYNGIRVEHLTRRVFSLPDSYFNQFKRFHHIARRSDIVKWYGIDVTGDPNLDKIHHRMMEIKRYKKQIEREVWVKVTITDPDTGRKVSVKQKNGNAFDVEEEALKLLRSSV